MSDDRLRELFEQVTRIAVDVPPAEHAVGRGRRRRRARLRVATIAWTMVLAGGVAAPQAAGLAWSGRPGLEPPVLASPAGTVQRQPSPTRLTLDSGGQSPRPANSGGQSPSSANSDKTTPSPTGAASNTANPPGAGSGWRRLASALPPPGTGRLLLGLDAAGRFVMTRMGSASAPVPLPGLGAAAGAPPVLVTNPAGGWVVMYASPKPWRTVRTAQLALVTTAGTSEPFGPMFFPEVVTSAAVSPDGSRVAVALSRPSALPRIEVLPLPGHRGADRSWRLRSVRATLVTSLSWAPDGRHLSFLPARPAGAAAGPVTLNTARRTSATSARSSWLSAEMAGATCVPDVTAWLGSSGRFAALEKCPAAGTEVFQTADARTGAPAGRAIVVARRPGCGPAALDPDPSGRRVLISYCGIYLDKHGTLTKAPRGLTAAALAG
ncbi:MAG TPA: hypothetical protein VEM58_14315 [Streptosporangiaceae bacterium]|nr:hypothetical protein [Streptosporangiaceae bacterium]